MKVLVACEESQAVTIAFRNAGHEAYSCDLQACTGGHPEWHIQGDVFDVINNGWDLMIAHPPCTYLTVTANKWLKDQPPLKSGALVGEARRNARLEAIDFFMKIANAPIKRIVIENPVGCMSTVWRKADQIIHPYYFGDEHRKATCLWLKNVPPLYHNKEINLFDDVITHVDQGESAEWIDGKTGKMKRQPKWYAMAKQGKELGDRSRERSKTFPSIATAMAEQWGRALELV
jgi:site-specific DNA-cytosine methylase